MKRLTFILPQFKPRAVQRRRVPSGLLSLAAEAQAVGGITVEVVDAESAGWGSAEVVERLTVSKPDVVGISVCSPTFPLGVELVDAIRTRIPETMIVLGGKYVTHCWQHASKLGTSVDALVRGEGESAVTVLARAVASGANRVEAVSALAALPNVWVHGKSSSPTLPLSVDLQNSRPWPFDTLTHSLDYYHGDRMLIEFSRGCPGRCSYCLASRDRQLLSYRPVSQVVETIEYLSARGVTSFFFTDDDFAASPNQLKRLLEGIIERNLSIKFDANVRPDSLVRCAKLAPLLNRAGCRCLWLGIESGSPKILESYGKGFDVDTCEQAVDIALSAADIVRTNWIIGPPMETEDTIRESMRFAERLRRLGPHLPHISFMVPYPGTEVCDEALEHGLITLSRLEGMANTTHGEPIIPSRFLSLNRLKELFREFHLGYYNPEFFAAVSSSVRCEAEEVLRSAGFSDSLSN